MQYLHTAFVAILLFNCTRTILTDTGKLSVSLTYKRLTGSLAFYLNTLSLAHSKKIYQTQYLWQMFLKS
jgi:hypothetical protein